MQSLTRNQLTPKGRVYYLHPFQRTVLLRQSSAFYNHAAFFRRLLGRRRWDTGSDNPLAGRILEDLLPGEDLRRSSQEERRPPSFDCSSLRTYPSEQHPTPSMPDTPARRRLSAPGSWKEAVHACLNDRTHNRTSRKLYLDDSLPLFHFLDHSPDEPPTGLKDRPRRRRLSADGAYPRHHARVNEGGLVDGDSLLEPAGSANLHERGGVGPRLPGLEAGETAEVLSRSFARPNNRGPLCVSSAKEHLPAGGGGRSRTSSQTLKDSLSDGRGRSFRSPFIIRRGGRRGRTCNFK